MIVRDESTFLGACLTSIRDVCDEIVIVDTGSVDDTVDIARSFGAVVRHFEWTNDFSEARNASLEVATGEWILYIDADEQLVDLDLERARRELEEADGIAALRTLFHIRPHFTPFREYRVWRHRPEIRFFSQIHETAVPDITRFALRENLSIEDSQHFTICHYGYEGDQTHKHRRNLPMLEEWTTKFPNRCYLWNHLAQVRSALGDDEGAMAAWQRGLGLIRSRGIEEKGDLSIFVGLGQELVDQELDATEVIADMRRLAPDFVLTDWIEARHLQNSGRHVEAIALFERLISVGPSVDDGAVGYDVRLFGEFAWAAIGASYMAVGNTSSALEMYERALVAAPDNVEYRTKVVALRSLVRR